MKSLNYKLATTLVLTMLIFTSASRAAILSYNGYTKNTGSSVIVGGGLEWLEWPKTWGDTVNWLLEGNATMEGGGWRLANIYEVSTLFNDFSLGTFDANETARQSYYTPYVEGDLDPHTQFINLFGQTADAYWQACPPLFCVTQAISTAIFKGNSNEQDDYRIAEVYQDGIAISGNIEEGTPEFDISVYLDARASLSRENLSATANINLNGRIGGGLVLVRNLIPVNETSTFGMFISALILIYVTRLRRLKGLE